MLLAVALGVWRALSTACCSWTQEDRSLGMSGKKRGVGI